MAGEWEGKSKGTVLGYKIFIFFIKKLGVRAAYLLLFLLLFIIFFLLEKAPNPFITTFTIDLNIIV